MNVKIDVWSDVVCPFCYVGKRKIELAIERLSLSDQVIIEYHSFQLDPSFPKGEGIPATEHLAKRKGVPLAGIIKAQQQLTDQGKQYGIDFQFEKAINFNTIDVHRLLHWSKTFQKENELKSALFKAHFSNGIDLSKSDSIKKIVNEVGLDGDLALTILATNQYHDEVQQDIATAQKIGIRGVPFFVFNNKLALSGAQPDSVFDEVLQEVLSTKY